MGVKRLQSECVSDVRPHPFTDGQRQFCPKHVVMVVSEERQLLGDTVVRNNSQILFIPGGDGADMKEKDKNPSVIVINCKTSIFIAKLFSFAPLLHCNVGNGIANSCQNFCVLGLQ